MVEVDSRVIPLVTPKKRILHSSVVIMKVKEVELWIFSVFLEKPLQREREREREH